MEDLLKSMEDFLAAGLISWGHWSRWSRLSNNIALMLASHMNKNLPDSPLIEKRGKDVKEILTEAEQFCANCLTAMESPYKPRDNIAHLDLFLVTHVLYHHQRDLGIKLFLHERDKLKKELDRYQEILRKIITYGPHAGQPLNDDEILHLFKFFNELANYVHVKISQIWRRRITRR